ncbi:MAG TPA: cupin domain-containing protein [Steroidobacteraceae bacterium]|jgi:hypothetical protein|nr:cupin domain-containing protein [Steroidobacteraceae bacterium]
MSVESFVKLGTGEVHLNPSPIRPGWILEGNPIARNKLLSSSADGTASTLIWDCTAGRFNWYYDVDETIYVIEGGVIVRDAAGSARRLCAGDAIFFPAGAHAEWHVENYIRKIAFCRVPLSRPILYAKRGYRFLKRVLRRNHSGGGASAAAMFQGS